MRESNYSGFCPVLKHWAEDSHTCWSRPCPFLCWVPLRARYSWASVWWRTAAGSFDVAIKISICLDSVRILQLCDNCVPVGHCVMAGMVCCGKTAFCLLCSAVPAKVSLVGCCWRGYSGPLHCQNFVVRFCSSTLLLRGSQNQEHCLKIMWLLNAVNSSWMNVLGSFAASCHLGTQRILLFLLI